MFIAGLICSDPECAQELDVVVEDLAELQQVACDCGCTLVVLSISDWTRAELPALV